MHPGAQVVKEATLQHCNVASCNRTYREISKAAASKSVCKPVATPKVSKGRAESPLVASAEAKPCETEKARRPFSLPSTRNLFLVRGFARLRADEVLSPRGKVPKGRRGRPKGACLMAAPGPPVAKLQCTASLAGARPARFTSVPGRATVAFGAADPSPGVWAPVYPWSDGKELLRQEHLAAVRAATKVPCKVRAHCGTRLVAGPRPNQMACPIRLLSVKKQGEVPLTPQGGSGGIPRPFEGGIGGPGGHRGEVGIPPAPLAGGANLQRKVISQYPEIVFFFTDKIILSKEKSFHKPSLSPLHRSKKQFYKTLLPQ